MNENIINDRIIKTLSMRFVEHVNRICLDINVPHDVVFISAIELSAALKEAGRDLIIMQQRRSPDESHRFSGISIGKIAGAICFRLARYRIVNIGETSDRTHGHIPTRKKRVFYRIQDIAIIMLVFNDILGTTMQPKTMRELLYIFSRRHINQEMLGVVFDSLK